MDDIPEVGDFVELVYEESNSREELRRAGRVQSISDEDDGMVAYVRTSESRGLGYYVSVANLLVQERPLYLMKVTAEILEAQDNPESDHNLVLNYTSDSVTRIGTDCSIEVLEESSRRFNALR